MNQFVFKVSGISDCPNGIVRPATPDDWEGGEVITPQAGPALARKGPHQAAPDIQEGDKVWIWTYEDKEYGDGLGLTATATAGAQREAGEFLAVRIHNVELLPHPVGFRKNAPNKYVFKNDTRLLSYLRANRHHGAYLIEEDDFEDFQRAIEDATRGLPDDIRYAGESEWARHIRENKENILADLTERRLNWQKVRPVQGKFRDDLFDVYDGRCLLTHCAVPEALEAAHVLPHNGDPVRDRADNGLLLRRDLHSMFDAMLWSIDPKTSMVRLARRLEDKSYRALDGKMIEHQVNADVLLFHFTQFNKADQHG
ncbi:HNH endonuclease [Sulfitobacter sp. D35]|uniref:HNH endonuclease n=1 Tax=Sulfitobacter sp. D35 TaxID=3083252 RepID=UPI00296F4E68|nr:HNH endonuclease [Sulfitobacter sp. D35]MDW4496358.1 HNH endonuclease [Sulfitobacter sp. D35]